MYGNSSLKFKENKIPTHCCPVFLPDIKNEFIKFFSSFMMIAHSLLEMLLKVTLNNIPKGELMVVQYFHEYLIPSFALRH